MTEPGATPARERIAAYARGRGAERGAVLYLRLFGWRILARRYRTPVGEIDIVARRGAVLAFVEVKARRDTRAALESVTPRQRQRIERAAGAFLSRHPKWSTLRLRFDVIAMTPWRLPRHVPDAWRPDGPWTITQGL